MRKTQILLLLLFVLQNIFAQESQEVTLTGTVRHPIYQLPISGAMVTVSGSNDNIIANEEGEYTLLCKEGNRIIVQYPGYETIEWTVDRSDSVCQKNFELQERAHVGQSYVEVTQLRRYFTLASTYSPKTENFGLALNYSYYFRGLSSTWFGRNILDNLSTSLTYAKPNWKNDNLLYPQLELNKPISISFLIPDYWISLSVGGGYYWDMKDNFKFHSGSCVFSTKVQSSSIPLAKVNLSLWGGYSWFVDRTTSNYASLGITFAPCW